MAKLIALQLIDEGYHAIYVNHVGLMEQAMTMLHDRQTAIEQEYKDAHGRNRGGYDHLEIIYPEDVRPPLRLRNLKMCNWEKATDPDPIQALANARIKYLRIVRDAIEHMNKYMKFTQGNV